MPQLKKILVAYDGSPHSKEALNWAIDLSLLSRAEVLVVKVFGESVLYATSEPGASFLTAIEEIRREDQRMINEAVVAAQTRGIEVTGEILEGNIAGEIISYAKKNNVDMIIAGTKGHGELKELLMGSVARSLVSLAHVPVLLVKD